MVNASEIEKQLLPHVDAAYNLARWLTGDDQDARDVVQEAYLKAFRFFDTMKGLDAKPWLLKIVRNSGYTWLEKNRGAREAVEYDDEVHGEPAAGADPESLLLQRLEQSRARHALERLPVAYREALVLYELEGLSYKEIAEVTGAAIGTVMSRISRGRARLQALVAAGNEAEDPK
ncbi:MAG: sigma-70 family RNA polymerase sigma factor [Deltaproteobacteria bacterium]|nr:sigma-70 family RNA polymerase sigma factor [Deltaproteobacteria bacterium]